MPTTALKSRARQIMAEPFFGYFGFQGRRVALARAKFEAANGTPAERFERAAQKIAADHGHDTARLQFEVTRRSSAGSFSTTLDGSVDRLALYRRAHEIAWARKRGAKHQGERVVAATSIVGGELVVCQGNALGPVVAGPFPRTEAGHKAALAAAE